jgi:hypothetical protein
MKTSDSKTICQSISERRTCQILPRQYARWEEIERGFLVTDRFQDIKEEIISGRAFRGQRFRDRRRR